MPNVLLRDCKNNPTAPLPTCRVLKVGFMATSKQIEWISSILKKKPMVNHRPGCSMLPSAILQSLYKLQPGVQGCSCSSTNLPIGEQWTSSKERIIYCDNELFSWRDVITNVRTYLLQLKMHKSTMISFYPERGFFVFLNAAWICEKYARRV